MERNPQYYILSLYCIFRIKLNSTQLQARNTPDPDCNISPAQVVFGRPIRDTFSFISRSIQNSNQSIRPIWREAWSQKEDAMRARMPRSTEALDMHMRLLSLLSLSDKLFLQNQRGSHPNKWDQICIATKSNKSPQLTTSFPQLEQQQQDGLSTPTKRPPPPSVQPTGAVFVSGASPRLDRGETESHITYAVIHPTSYTG